MAIPFTHEIQLLPTQLFFISRYVTGRNYTSTFIRTVPGQDQDLAPVKILVCNHISSFHAAEVGSFCSSPGGLQRAHHCSAPLLGQSSERSHKVSLHMGLWWQVNQAQSRGCRCWVGDVWVRNDSRFSLVTAFSLMTKIIIILAKQHARLSSDPPGSAVLCPMQVSALFTSQASKYLPNVQTKAGLKFRPLQPPYRGFFADPEPVRSQDPVWLVTVHIDAPHAPRHLRSRSRTSHTDAVPRHTQYCTLNECRPLVRRHMFWTKESREKLWF